MRAVLVLCLAFAPAMMVFGQSAQKPDWTAWKFLMGDWVSDGPAIQGSGAFSFRPELDGRVLVRRNRADLPASPEHSSASHADLLLLYPEAGALRAEYFDNEGHVIHYRASVANDGKSATFVSDPAAGAPRFRLSYALLAGERVRVRFEIAPPGQPDGFKTYVEGTVHRAPAKAAGARR